MPDPRLDLDLRSAADTQGEVQRVLSKLEAAGNDLKILKILANAEHAFRPFVLLSNALMNLAAFPAADREVVVLHLAARRGVPYEWNEHVPMSTAAGLSDEQRKLISVGDYDGGSFTGAQRLSVCAADEIINERALSNKTWRKACETWGNDAALELILIVAWWGSFVPTIIEAIGLQSPG